MTITLNGSDKQVAWAQQLIDNASKTINTNLTNKEAIADQIPGGANARATEVWQKIKADFEKMIEALDNQPGNAAKIIDRRNSIDPSQICRIADKLNMKATNAN